MSVFLTIWRWWKVRIYWVLLVGIGNALALGLKKLKNMTTNTLKFQFALEQAINDAKAYFKQAYEHYEIWEKYDRNTLNNQRGTKNED